MSRLDAAYTERAHLVALLAALYPSHIGYNDPSSPEWAVVTIEAPTGQMSWHIGTHDMPLFQHVLKTTHQHQLWDGHTTEEKYRRMDILTEMLTCAA